MLPIAEIPLHQKPFLEEGVYQGNKVHCGYKELWGKNEQSYKVQSPHAGFGQREEKGHPEATVGCHARNQGCAAVLLAGNGTYTGSLTIFLLGLFQIPPLTHPSHTHVMHMLQTCLIPHTCYMPHIGPQTQKSNHTEVCAVSLTPGTGQL